MPLNDLAIKQAKAAKTLVKHSDGDGLQLWVFPDGAKRWRLAYRFDGKQKSLALGVYPEVSLRAARDQRTETRRLLATGVDPGQQRRLDKLVSATARTNTFGAIADEVLDKKRREGLADATLSKAEWLIGIAKPALGARVITEITAPEVLAVLRQVEARGTHETANRLRSVIGEVFRYGIATGRAETDPTQALKGALTAATVTHRAAVTTSLPFGGLMRAIEGYDGTPETRIALQLLALTFVRPGELRLAEWSELNIETAIWSIPAERMKMRRPHKVPLAPQAVALIIQLKDLTGRGKYLFPSVRSFSRCMSENTLNGALRRLGYTTVDMTAHGFRAAASSMLNESGAWNADAIEAQLAHVEGNAVRKAYARAEYWDERVSMMNGWADKIDEMRRGGVVVPLRA